LAGYGVRMDDAPDISLVIPAFNEAAYLPGRNMTDSSAGTKRTNRRPR
jgi:hypothetical protein